MDQDSLYSSKKEGKNSELDDQIDLDYIFKLLLKNKKFISLIILLGFFIGLVKSFITKPTWRGEFEIVLSNPNDAKRSMLGSAESILLSNLGDNAKSQLKTEVTVLKSPSVLMSIFEYVKNDKIIGTLTRREKSWT